MTWNLLRLTNISNTHYILKLAIGSTFKSVTGIYIKKNKNGL